MNKGPEVKETAFLYFHISLFACSHNTRSPASDYIRCIRTRVFKMQTPDMLKIPESGLIHFLLYWLRYKNKNGCVIYYLRTASKTEVGKTVPENTCSAPTNMICYRQSRNILLNRIGHGAFGYSLRFSHFYGDAILNYLLEFFFA